MENSYNELIGKLDQFIRKYYTNQLIRGALYSVALLGSFLLIFTQLESIAWFTVPVRSVLFYSYIAGALFILGRYVVVPLLKLSKAGKRISHEYAASIIGTHFTEVRDTLLNTLQLNELMESNSADSELILAGIRQKTEKLRPVPFVSAIDFSKNRKYLYMAIPPVLILLLLIVFAPGALTGPGNRLIRHNIVFEKPLPFSISIVNKELKAVQLEDFTLRIHIEGDEIPAEVSLVANGSEFRMQADDKVNYSYTFKKLQKNQVFSFLAAGHYTSDYEIVVLPKPIILNFDLDLDYPSYTGQKRELLSNTGDATVPEGTVVTWKFYTRDTRAVNLRLDKLLLHSEIINGNTARVMRRLKEPTPYSVSIENEFMKGSDSMSFFINVLPDLSPLISVEEYRDSVYDNRLYFRGLIKDDYGFRNMEFHLARRNPDGETSAERVLPVTIDKQNTQQQFYYFFDVAGAGLSPGDEVEYYFIVWDNDAINGSKPARSQKMSLRIPTRDEIEAMVRKNQTEVKNDLEKSIDEAKKIQNEVSQLNKKLLDKKTLSYQDKKQIQDLLERQKNLQQQVEEMRQQNERTNQKESQFSEVNPSLLEKQQQLEKLFSEIMTDEMKQMFDELQKMMDNLDKDKLNDVMDKMKMGAEDMEKNLDRNLELFKQLEFDKRLTETIDKLKSLSETQKKLAEQTQNSSAKEKESLSKEQQKVNDAFDAVKKELLELSKLNQALEEPNNFTIPEEKQKETQQNLNEAGAELKDGQMKKASKSQEDASEDMQQMSDMLFEMQQEMEEDALGEDIETLRAILENLVRISFDQEDLINRLGVISRNDPKYIQLMDEQKAIKDNLLMVEDSLYALSKRQAMIEPYVNREINDINENAAQAQAALSDRVIPTARSKQQYVMTSVNNLALMLAESMKKMQQNMSMKSSGKSGKSCPMPGQGKPSMKSMRQMQQKLNQQMEALKKSMEQGKGEKGKSGQGAMSEQLARMAAQQEALRRQLQEYRDQLQKGGNVGQNGLNKMIEQMEQSETELVNKILNQQTMQRQEEILTRLLESEKAEMQRDQEERRESNQGKEMPHPDPATYFDKLGLPSKETELLRTIPPSLKPYYKNKVNAYFLDLPGKR